MARLEYKTELTGALSVAIDMLDAVNEMPVRSMSVKLLLANAFK